MKKGDNYYVFQSEAKQTGLTVAALLLVAASIFVVALGYFEGDELLFWVGVLATLVFGLVTAFIVKNFFSRKVLVQLSPAGFFDYSSSSGPNNLLVRWQDVASIKETGTEKQGFISVYLVNTDAFLRQLSASRRKAVEANLAMGYGEINITLQAAKKETLTNLAVEMRRYLLEYQQKQHISVRKAEGLPNETIFD